MLKAMRATHLHAPQNRKLWEIRRVDVDSMESESVRMWVRETYGYADYPALDVVTTGLYRYTDATLHDGGECVMSDDPRELRRHLPAVLSASGHVLVTGLGLGCVVRGLLTNPRVTHIDVIEVDTGVLEMVGPTFNGEPRVALYHGDALRYRWPRDARWDFAWHDVWNDTPDTQVIHAMLLTRYHKLARHQGAWGFPRWMKRLTADRFQLVG